MFKSKKIKELNQRIKELENTCDNLEILVDYKNDIIKDLLNKDEENEYRINLLEKEKLELNNVIANLMEERNKEEVKKVQKKRSAKSAKQNTSM